MTVIQMLQLLKEAQALFAELEADGTIKEIMEAEQAIAKHMQGNDKLKQLIEKLGHVLPHPEQK